MTDNNRMIEEAEVLYKNGCYSEASEKCLEVIKTGESIKEAYLLWAKAYLFLIPITMAEDEKYTKNFYNSIVKVISCCETFEEMFTAEAEICSTINEWEKFCLKEQINFIVKNPTLANWKTHINTWVTASKMKCYVQLYVVNTPAFKKLQEESGETPRAIREKYDVKYENEITKEEKCDLYFSAACEIFDGAVAFHEEYQNTSSEALQAVLDQMIERFNVSQLVMDSGIAEGIADESERLIKLAEILNYIINAEVFPNGKRLVLFSTKSDDYFVNNLKKTYSRIKELDDSFVIPQIVIPEPTPTQPTGGGCYVATAVYGSYDCPEVWTLRRFRDNTLAETWYGRAFIRTYYAISPTLVKWFGKTEWFKNMWKPSLDKLVKRLNNNGVGNTVYNDREW